MDRLVVRAQGTVHPAIEVRERNDVRYLRFGSGGGWQGAEHITNVTAGAESEYRLLRPIFAYQRAFAAVLESLENIHSFLCLGVGTGTALRSVANRFPSAGLTGVELDECVVDLAIEWFGAPTRREANYLIGDGVGYACTSQDQFDLIFVDMYSRNEIYSPSLNPLFLRALHLAAPNGVVVCNLICPQPPMGRTARFLSEATELFAYVGRLPVGAPIPFADQNMLAIFAHDVELPVRLEQAIRREKRLHVLERFCWPWRLQQESPRVNPVI